MRLEVIDRVAGVQGPSDAACAAQQTPGIAAARAPGTQVAPGASVTSERLAASALAAIIRSQSTERCYGLVGSNWTGRSCQAM